METILIFIIAGGVALFISLPFLSVGHKREDKTDKSAQEVQDSPISNKLRILKDRKESLYTAIKDIEFDYSLGKLSLKDYKELAEQYKLEASKTLKEIDNINKGRDYRES